MRFYNQQHAYYWGVDRHARSMYTPAALYPEGVSYQSPGSRFAHPGKRTTRVNFTPKGLDNHVLALVEPLRGTEHLTVACPRVALR